MVADYTFNLHKSAENFNASVITGCCRSGKTTLGNLLSTADYVENAEEPWVPMMLPIISGINMINEKSAIELFDASVVELFNELILLRGANFRPDELSSIYRQKTLSEISDRLTNFKNREDVATFIGRHKPLLLLNLAETSHFLSFFFKTSIISKVILVTRECRSVVADVTSKGWLSNNHLKHPKNRIPYRNYKYNNQEWSIPWWVQNNDEEYFINLVEMDRAAYYWYQFTKLSKNSINKMNSGNFILKITYEDLIANPTLVFERFATLFSASICKQLKHFKSAVTIGPTCS